MGRSNPLAAALLASSLTGVLRPVAAGCLGFVDTAALPKCYKGTLLCLGEYDDSCKKGENQLLLSVTNQGRDRRKNEAQIGLMLENEGAFKSALETIWIEDEYMLLSGMSAMQPIINSQGVRYHVASNSTVFADALAHHVPFDQHFVASCVASGVSSGSMGASAMRSLRRLSSDEMLSCVRNSGDNNKHDSVTLIFDTKCTVEEIETALSVGLIRVGTQLGGFATRGPRRKSFTTCQDIIEVETYTVNEEDRFTDSFDFEDDEFWEDDDSDEEDYAHETDDADWELNKHRPASG